jgi:hypothetical protein
MPDFASAVHRMLSAVTAGIARGGVRRQRFPGEPHVANFSCCTRVSLAARSTTYGPNAVPPRDCLQQTTERYRQQQRDAIPNVAAVYSGWPYACSMGRRRRSVRSNRKPAH